MTFRRLTRILHLSLVIAGVFALTCFGVLCIKAYPTVMSLSRITARAEQDQIAAEQQGNLASHTMGIILTRVAVITDETAKLTVAEQRYWREQNMQMTSIFNQAHAAIAQFNDRLVPSAVRATDSLNGAIQQVNGEVSDLRTQQKSVVGDIRVSLGKLQTTQDLLNEKIAALPIDVLVHKAVSIEAHVDKITGDTEYVANDLKGRYIKSQKPQPWYKRYPETAGKMLLFGVTVWHPW